MEEFQRCLTEQEMTAELAKNPQEIDYDYLLKRGGGPSNFNRVYYAVEYELRHMPGGDEKWRQVIAEYFASHNPDTDGTRWMAQRMNEVMGSPLKFAPLPDWDRPFK